MEQIRKIHQKMDKKYTIPVVLGWFRSHKVLCTYMLIRSHPINFDNV